MVKEFFIYVRYYHQRELSRDDVCVCLASDGFWDVADEEDVTQIVFAASSRRGANPGSWSSADMYRVPATLCEVAKNRGSADNITACVVFL